ncbi:MAG: hypothetical protein WB566_13315 [Terriglobales bacterium]
MPFHAKPIAVILLTLSVLCGCARPPADDASNSDSQKLPFDRQPRSTGVSPSQSLIPSTTKLPEGTGIPVRLQNLLSSSSSHAGDTFIATIDDPVLIDGQTVIPSGTAATGRVLEAKPAARSAESSLEPGYLRIVLVSLNVGGKTIMIETSSIFAKGGSRDERNAKPRKASSSASKDKDIVFGKDRRLNFRLAQAADLQ